MTYFAPRRGTFAVIVLISFCLTLLTFVKTTQYAQDNHKKAVAQFIATQLDDHAKNALSLGDRVSLSVLSNRYLIDDGVGFIGFYDTQKTPLVEVGNMTTGQSVWQDVHDNANLVGSIKVQATPTSYADILAYHWLFLIAVLVLHIFIWLIYGYLATPNKALIAQITKDAKDKLIAQGVLDDRIHPNTDDNTDTTNTHTQPDNFVKSTPKNVAEFLQSAKHSNASDTIAQPTDDTTQYTSDTSIDCVVHVVFDDKDNLLDMLSDDRLLPYLKLCDELLQKSVRKLLALPNLSKVKLIKIDNFDKTGACVRFANTQDDDRNVLAGAILAKLMPMVNKVIYDKHRDIHKFALPMRAIASTSDKAMHASGLLKRYPNTSMMLMNPPSAKIIAGVMNVVAPKNPASIHEKECRFLEEVSDTVANQLHKVRYQVLTDDN